MAARPTTVGEVAPPYPDRGNDQLSKDCTKAREETADRFVIDRFEVEQWYRKARCEEDVERNISRIESAPCEFQAQTVDVDKMQKNLAKTLPNVLVRQRYPFPGSAA